MKRLIIGTSLTVALLLAGCAEESTDTKKSEPTTTAKTEKKEKPKTKEKEVDTKEEPKVEKSEVGEKTAYFTNKSLGIKEKLGPINLSIDKIQTSRLKVSDAFKPTFGDQDEVTTIVINMTLENTSDDTISVYPEQATLTTNTGEQIEADLFLSDQIGGEFIGKVKKSGNVLFLAKSQPKDITSIKYILDGPHDQELNSLADRYTVEISTKN
ncbi:MULTISPECIES: DUF4352 domain-containing protein [Exiguobacterium]|uniref:DUF4352 domain-containing protein n=1 Tax=Exiguobacterium TaxID=33986 RepID=UPI001BE87B45|nr:MULTISPECIES: DUF4352 domain-containing protein [Exiguobacterium]MCT4792426.1 DUF4352 domain-containing protein [Exiguobacterium artemiae]